MRRTIAAFCEGDALQTTTAAQPEASWASFASAGVPVYGNQAVTNSHSAKRPNDIALSQLQLQAKQHGLGKPCFPRSIAGISNYPKSICRANHGLHWTAIDQDVPNRKLRSMSQHTERTLFTKAKGYSGMQGSMQDRAVTPHLGCD